MKALVLTGDGINCEKETAEALKAVGFQAQVRHLNDVVAEGLSTDALQSQYACLAMPGGFSFGDDLGSGKVLALKIRHGLKWDLPSYAKKGGLVVGICNGFQALIKMQVFGGDISICQNAHGKFMDDWADLQVEGTSSVWLKGLTKLSLPIRHGEGRVVVSTDVNAGAKSPLTCLRYVGDPNGSFQQTAGLTDESGRILGLMPHPEAHVRKSQHPAWNIKPQDAFQKADGLRLFENAFQEAKNAR